MDISQARFKADLLSDKIIVCKFFDTDLMMLMLRVSTLFIVLCYFDFFFLIYKRQTAGYADSLGAAKVRCVPTLQSC